MSHDVSSPYISASGVPMDINGHAPTDLSGVANFVHFPRIHHGATPSRKQPKRRFEEKMSGAFTDRGTYQGLPQIGTAHAIATPAVATTAAHPHTSREHRSGPSLSISAPTASFAAAASNAAADDSPDGSGAPVKPLSAWAQGSTAGQVQSVTKKSQFATDEARASAWKKAAMDSELAHVQRRRKKKGGFKTRQQQLEADERRRAAAAAAESPPVTPPAEEQPYVREIVRYLRPVSRTAETATDTAISKSLYGGRSGSISLKSLLQDQQAGSTLHQRKESLGIEPLSAGLGGHHRSGSLSRNNSGGSTPTRNSGRTSKMKSPRDHRRNSSVRSRKGSITPLGAMGMMSGNSKNSSRAHSPSSALLQSFAAGRGILESITDDGTLDSLDPERTSAYYTIIQSATKRIQDYVNTLEPDEEYELREEYKKQGMTEGEIEQKIKRRQIAIANTHTQFQQSLAASLAATGNQAVGGSGSGAANTMLFSPFTPQQSNSISSAQLTPSQYDRYRESFSTVTTLLNSLEKNQSKGSLFQDVHSFFQEKKKNELQENKKLGQLENENLEKEESVEQSKASISQTIKAKELHTIKVLNQYYSNLRKIHQQHELKSHSQANLHAAAGGDTAGPIGKQSTLKQPSGLSLDIDFLTLGHTDPTTTTADPIAEAFAQLDFQGLNILPSGSTSVDAFDSPRRASLGSMSNLKPPPGLSTAGLGHSKSTSTISTNEAMEILQEKLSGDYGGEEALTLKLELLISMLYAKLQEQNHILSLHQPLHQRKIAFEEKTAGLIQKIVQAQTLLQQESELKSQVLQEHKQLEDRFAHLSHFESQETMLASLSLERTAAMKIQEEKEESHLSTLHADRHAVETHVQELEKAYVEFSTRMKRMDAELIHVQKLREQDRLKNKFLEKKMRKELILVLNGQIPASLQKELAQEQEELLRQKRAQERMDRSEPIRLDPNASTAAAAKRRSGVMGSEGILANLLDPQQQQQLQEQKDKESRQHDDHSDDSDGEKGEKEKENHPDSTDPSSRHPASRKGSVNTARTPSLRPGGRDIGSASSRPGTRPHGESGSRGASRSRQGSPTAPAPLILNPDETPAALTTIRDGVAMLEKYRVHLLGLIESEVKTMTDMGIPLAEQGPGDERRKSRRRTNTMSSLKEGEENEEHGAGTGKGKSPSVSSKRKGRMLRRSIGEDGESRAESPAARKRSPSDTPARRRGKKGRAHSRRRSVESDEGDNKAASAKKHEKQKSSLGTSGGGSASSKNAKSSPRGQKRSVDRRVEKSPSSRSHVSQKSEALEHAGSNKKSSETTDSKDKKGTKKSTDAKDKQAADAAAAATAAAEAKAEAEKAAAANLAVIAAKAAAESGKRRLSFESRYAALLAAPDPSISVGPNVDQEVIIDFDASGKINGAFTRKEMRAQTMRFKSQIQSLEKERVAMLEEITKLEGVVPKMQATEAQAEALQNTLTTLEVELADLMSSLRALHLEANSHGLVIGSASDLSADDIAEHAIWVEDGFAGETRIPMVDAEEDWTPAWQVEEDKRVAIAQQQRQDEADRIKLAKLKEEVDQARKARVARDAANTLSPIASPRASMGGSLASVLPTVVVSDSDIAPILSAAEAAALAAELQEDELEEEDELRIAKDAWEDSFREEQEEKLRSITASKTQRFTNKLTKFQAQLDSAQRPTGAEADLAREKMSKLSEKVNAILRAKDEEIAAALQTAEPKWLEEWEAGRAERAARRKAARDEVKRLEAQAVRADAARLKKEKRKEATQAQGQATTQRRNTVFAQRRQQQAPMAASPRASGQHNFATPQTGASKNAGSAAAATGKSATVVAHGSRDKPAGKAGAKAKAQANAVAVAGAAAATTVDATAPVANSTALPTVSSTAATNADATGPNQPASGEATSISSVDAPTVHSELDAVLESGPSPIPAATPELVPVPLALLPLHETQARLHHTKAELETQIHFVQRQIEAKRSGLAPPAYSASAAATSMFGRPSPYPLGASGHQHLFASSGLGGVHHASIGVAIAGDIRSAGQQTALALLGSTGVRSTSQQGAISLLGQQVGGSRAPSQQASVLFQPPPGSLLLSPSTSAPHLGVGAPPEAQPIPTTSIPLQFVPHPAPSGPDGQLPILPHTTDYLQQDVHALTMQHQLEKQQAGQNTTSGRGGVPTAITSGNVDSDPDAIDAGLLLGALTSRDRSLRRAQALAAAASVQGGAGGGGRTHHTRELSVLGTAAQVIPGMSTTAAVAAKRRSWKNEEQGTGEQGQTGMMDMSTLDSGGDLSPTFSNDPSHRVALPVKLASGFTAHGAPLRGATGTAQLSSKTKPNAPLLRGLVVAPVDESFVISSTTTSRTIAPSTGGIGVASGSMDASGEASPTSIGSGWNSNPLSPGPLSSAPLFVGPASAHQQWTNPGAAYSGPLVRVSASERRASTVIGTQQQQHPVLRTLNFSSLLAGDDPYAPTVSGFVPASVSSNSIGAAPTIESARVVSRAPINSIPVRQVETGRTKNERKIHYAASAVETIPSSGVEIVRDTGISSVTNVSGGFMISSVPVASTRSFVPVSQPSSRVSGARVQAPPVGRSIVDLNAHLGLSISGAKTRAAASGNASTGAGINTKVRRSRSRSPQPSIRPSIPTTASVPSLLHPSQSRSLQSYASAALLEHTPKSIAHGIQIATYPSTTNQPLVSQSTPGVHDLIAANLRAQLAERSVEVPIPSASVGVDSMVAGPPSQFGRSPPSSIRQFSTSPSRVPIAVKSAPRDHLDSFMITSANRTNQQEPSGTIQTARVSRSISSKRLTPKGPIGSVTERAAAALTSQMTPFLSSTLPDTIPHPVEDIPHPDSYVRALLSSTKRSSAYLKGRLRIVEKTTGTTETKQH